MLTLLSMFWIFGFDQNCSAALVNRWSFNSTGNATHNTTFPDSVSGAALTLVGSGASLNGTSVSLPGTTNGDRIPSAASAYLDLPNGILSTKTNFSLEIWATPLSNGMWTRLFEFGRMSRTGMGTGAVAGEIRPDASSAPGSTVSSDTIAFIPSRGGSANTQQLEGRLNGGSTFASQTSQTINTGMRYHFVFVFEDGGSGAAGGQLRWFLNGNLVSSVDLPFKLRDIEDVNNWLGRSQWTENANINASYDEVRIYDHAMTAGEVSTSSANGPNAGFGPPVAVADTQTMHRLQKALIPVLSNDTGSVSTVGVTIQTPPQFGTAVPDGAGRVLYQNTSGVSATDQFTYTVSGPGGMSSPATVTINLANQLRITPPALNVPATPPATTLAIVDAFPGLTFDLPVHLASPPSDTRRLFVCQKGGLLRVIPDVTAATPSATTFLNLPAVLASAGESLETNSECGLLSVAFHPNYATNRQLYVFYSVNTTGGLHQRVARFTANATSPNVADPASQEILFQQRDEADNHNGGDMAFGTDGYLYISTGDEGGQNDQFTNSQTITRDFFCSILRIDVDRLPANLEPNSHAGIPTPGGVARFKVPSDNPFVGATSFNGVTISNPAAIRTELWATGFRNPWRMSFDSTTGDLYVADVGGGQREEVNIATRGGNFGWAVREGTLGGPRSGGTALGAINPLYEYAHGSGAFEGRSITGGVFARANRFALLNNAYFFSDYVSGNVWSLRRNGAAVNVERVGGEGSVAGFGRDPSNNDVLLAKLVPGSIRRLVATSVTGSFPQTLAETGLFADLSDLSPAPGVLPYIVNRTFWSDFAEKRRWFVLPDPASRFTWTPEGTWIAPAGGIWIKHFDMEMTRGNPATKRRLETRLLVRNSTGSYGVSYRWNDAGTVATLAPDEGVDFPLNIAVGSTIAPQVWAIPSRTSCISCHNVPAGHMLSFKTRQLNQTNTINGFAGNQIDTLATAGYFTNPVPPANTQPRHIRPEETSATLASHVRSYLEVNCAYCHMPGGTAPSNWDSREITPISATGLINGLANNAGSNPLHRLIVPGNPGLSVLLKRVAATDGFSRMPPIASNVLDSEAIAQIQDWIATSLPARQNYSAWRVQKFGVSGGGASGEATANPDGDQANNQSEFLIGTEPDSGSSYPNATLTTDGNQITISLNVPANRLVWVETSTDLVTWTRWNVPGNNGLPGPAGARSFTGPLSSDKQFFRPVVSED